MSLTGHHARTQSALPSLDMPDILSPSAPGQNQRHSRSDSVDIATTFHQPHSAGECSVQLVGLARNPHHHLRDAATTPSQIVAPPRVASPLRPALGSKFLSSLSNAQPAAAALTRKGSVLHSRAKSLAAFVPNLNPSTTSTPEKSQSRPARLFGDLFQGESAPIRLGPPISPTKELDESEFIMEYKSAFTHRPALLRRRETAPQVAAITSPTKPSSSSWFSRKPTNPIQSKPPQDELATLNINSALFPNGPADPLDPTAFNNLLLNATNLLHRMQAAYREKVDYIHSMRPEQEAQRDEVEEAETRATHLKKQLEDMSRRAQEQETTLKEMAHELAEEKMKNLQATEAASTIRLVSASTGDKDNIDDHTGTVRRRKRGSTSNASDSGFESDLESIFSSYSVGQLDSPLFPPPISRMTSFESRLNSPQHAPDPSETRSRPKPNPIETGRGMQRLGREGAAWATVDALRGENKELKRHLQEMQECLQGCIELVSVATAS